MYYGLETGVASTPLLAQVPYCSAPNIDFTTVSPLANNYFRSHGMFARFIGTSGNSASKRWLRCADLSRRNRLQSLLLLIQLPLLCLLLSISQFKSFRRHPLLQLLPLFCLLLWLVYPWLYSISLLWLKRASDRCLPRAIPSYAADVTTLNATVSSGFSLSRQ